MQLDLFTIATDVQKLTMEFLEPEEIKTLFETYKETKVMFEELTKHTNFVVDCKRIITDEELQFFESQNIQLKLLETYELKNGTQFWYKNGVIHRDNDKPAIINSDGAQYWYQNGRIHRNNNLPAIILPSGSQHWYQNGKAHRDNDLPAIIFSNGDQHWYQNGFRYKPKPS
jgi:antitoxin component YwqK of YwqJK toxin-antitoxin module